MKTVLSAAVVLSAAASIVGQAASVRLAVGVVDGGRVVVGLTASDFSLTDNDVRQQVEAVALESMPLDVTLVVDAHGGPTGIVDQVTRDIQEIARIVRKGDRLRVVRYDAFVEQSPAPGPTRNEKPTQPTVSPQIGPMRSFTAWSLHDALLTALVRPIAENRPQLVVAVTTGLDTMSVTTADRLREVASRSDAVLHVVNVRPASGSNVVRGSIRPRYTDDSILILSDAAERTGGELRGRGLLGDTDLLSSFKRVFAEFRQGYWLRYSPRSSEDAGWHELLVTVPTVPNATVRARRGYYGS
jgi:hypothetical protein